MIELLDAEARAYRCWCRVMCAGDKMYILQRNIVIGHLEIDDYHVEVEGLDRILEKGVMLG